MSFAELRLERCGLAPLTNLNAARNSLWFQLRGGLSRHVSLQTAWKQYAEETFTLQVLEQTDEDLAPLLLQDTLRARKKHWRMR